VLILIDANASAPVFEQIADQVAGQIADGTLEQGSRLPAARDLAEALEVNVHTVLHAYQRLRDESLIELRRGRGAVVTGLAVDENVRRAVEHSVASARAAGISLTSLIALIRSEYTR